MLIHIFVLLQFANGYTDPFYISFSFPRLPIIRVLANQSGLEMVKAGYGYTHLDRFGNYEVYKFRVYNVYVYKHFKSNLIH